MLDHREGETLTNWLRTKSFIPKAKPQLGNSCSMSPKKDRSQHLLKRIFLQSYKSRKIDSHEKTKLNNSQKRKPNRKISGWQYSTKHRGISIHLLALRILALFDNITWKSPLAIILLPPTIPRLENCTLSIS